MLGKSRQRRIARAVLIVGTVIPSVIWGRTAGSDTLSAGSAVLVASSMMGGTEPPASPNSPGISQEMPGGTLLQAAHGGYCTATMGIRSRQGERFMLTAGHCLRELGNPWYTRPDQKYWTTNRTSYYVGSITQDGWSAGLDVGFIPSGWSNERVYTGLGDVPLAPDAVSPRPGLGVCKTGMGVGYTCNLVVTSADMHYRLRGEAAVFDGFEFCSRDGTAAALPGDSGGPLYVWNRDGSGVSIVGVTSGTLEDTNNSCGVAATMTRVIQHFGLVIDDAGIP